MAYTAGDDASRALLLATAGLARAWAGREEQQRETNYDARIKAPSRHGPPAEITLSCLPHRPEALDRVHAINGRRQPVRCGRAHNNTPKDDRFVRAKRCMKS
jgi:hypothetical protein